MHEYSYLITLVTEWAIVYCVKWNTLNISTINSELQRQVKQLRHSGLIMYTFQMRTMLCALTLNILF